MAAISGLTFSPWVDHKGARALGCFTCEHWLGEFAGDSGQSVCRRDDPWLHVPGTARNSCAFWMRATGAKFREAMDIAVARWQYRLERDVLELDRSLKPEHVRSHLRVLA